MIVWPLRDSYMVILWRAQATFVWLLRDRSLCESIWVWCVFSFVCHCHSALIWQQEMRHLQQIDIRPLEDTTDLCNVMQSRLLKPQTVRYIHSKTTQVTLRSRLNFIEHEKDLSGNIAVTLECWCEHVEYIDLLLIIKHLTNRRQITCHSLYISLHVVLAHFEGN